MILNWLPLLFKGRIRALYWKNLNFKLWCFLQIQENILVLTRCNIFVQHKTFIISKYPKILVTYINFPAAFKCYNSKQIDKSFIFHWSNILKLPCGKFWKIFEITLIKIFKRNWSILSLKNKYLNLSN